MDLTFVRLLKRAIKEIFAKNLLNDVKVFLAGFIRNTTEAIKETNDNIQLMKLLRKYFSLSNISALKELFDDCEIEHNAHDLDELLRNRDAFYKKILAKDFALEAIEIYEDSERYSTGSTVSY